MSLNNNQENEQPFNEDFSEEIENFDSDPAVVSATEAISSKNKSGWLILLIGILGTGAYLGYRYYFVPHGTALSGNENTNTVPPVAQGDMDKSTRQAHKNAQFDHLKNQLFGNESNTAKTVIAIPSPTQPVHKTPAAPVTSTVTTTAATTITETPKAATPQPTVTTMPQAAQNAASPTSMSDAVQQVTQLNERLEVNIHQIQHLEEVLLGITQTIAKLNTDINAMDNRLSALSNSTGNLSSDVGTMKHEMSSVKRVLREEGVLDTQVPPPPSHTYLKASQVASTRPKSSVPAYVVHAVIPGRAWLKSNNGQITTVTEGDTLGDYGKVLVIDAASGMVLTSSGNTFQ